MESFREPGSVNLLSPAERLYNRDLALEKGAMVVKEEDLEKVIGGHVEEARKETDRLENRLNNMEYWLKVGGVLLLLYILHSVMFGGQPSCGDGPRMHQMEEQIQGLQLLWSKPEQAILNAKYTVLAAELTKYQTEILQVQALYKNLTSIDRRLGDIKAEISSIQTLQSDADKVIARVKNALAALTSMEAGIDVKLKKGLEEAREKAATVGVEAVDAGIEKVNKTVNAFDHHISKSVAAANAEVDSAIKQMHQAIAGYDTKTKEDLLASVAQQMSTMDGRVDRMVKHTDAEVSNISARVKAAEAKFATVEDAVVAKATTIAEDAKAQAIAKATAIADGIEVLAKSAKESGEKALAGIENVGFFKMRGSDCPADAQPCDLWHFMSPQLLDPYCGSQNKRDAVSGDCRVSSKSGELEQRMYGCCRNKATLSAHNAIDMQKRQYCGPNDKDTTRQGYKPNTCIP